MEPKALSETQPIYYPRLDVIRGVAVLWVVAFHFCGGMWGWDEAVWPARCDVLPAWAIWPGKALVHLIGLGTVAVPMFFVLSGFLIHLTYSRSGNPSLSLFWWRRWRRIYPAYFVALVAFALWSGVFLSKAGREDFGLHVLLLHNLKDRTLFGINPSFWSLAVEAQLYLLYPLLLQVRRSIGMPALVFLALGLRLGIGIAIEAIPGRFAGDPAITMMLPRLWFEWILGMYVADCLLQGRRAFSHGWIVGLLCLIAAIAGSNNGWWNLGVVPAMSLATAIWIDSVVHQQRPPRRLERAFIPVGVISYSIYLWHQPIVTGLIASMHSGWLSSEFGGGGIFVVTAVLCLGISTLVGAAMYVGVERPAIKLGRWIERRFFVRRGVEFTNAADVPEPAGRSTRRAA